MAVKKTNNKENKETNKKTQTLFIQSVIKGQTLLLIRNSDQYKNRTAKLPVIFTVLQFYFLPCMNKYEGFVATLAVTEPAGIWFNKDLINPIKS